MFFLQNCINIYAAYQLDLRRGVRCLNQMDIFFKMAKQILPEFIKISGY